VYKLTGEARWGWQHHADWRRQWRTKRIDIMKNSTMGLDVTEQEILAFEVSDEALESAAGTAKEKANFTLGACSGLSVCGG
jgi:hypothetical protein